MYLMKEFNIMPEIAETFQRITLEGSVKMSSNGKPIDWNENGQQQTQYPKSFFGAGKTMGPKTIAILDESASMIEQNDEELEIPQNNN